MGEEKPLKIGAFLKEKRIAGGITLANIEMRLKIAKKYLIAIEEGNFESLPQGSVYRRNFIKKYADVLGVKVEEINELKLENEENVETKQLKPRIQRKYLFNLPRTVARSALFGIAVLVFIYISYQVRNILRPPALEVYKPAQGLVSTNNIIQVAGKTEKEARVEINGEQVYINEDGNFIEDVAIQNGLNVISIVAEKKHGKKIQVQRQVIGRQTQEINL